MKEADRVHLFRGAPPVRIWSMYQETDKRWTLCGIKRKENLKTPEKSAGRWCTEELAQCNCEFCLCLMRTGTRRAGEKAKHAASAAG